MRIAFLMVTIVLSSMTTAMAPANSANLYEPNTWSSLASDQKARQQGDTVTIVVYENASAMNSASSGSKRNNNIDGRVFAGPTFDESAGLRLDGASGNQGSTGRSGQMVAQISATVVDVMENGDLVVSGSQVLNINGEETTIQVKGRVRPSDITAGNVVASSRLADAMIDYNGSGFVTRSGKPGFLTRIFNWMGLL